MTTDEVLAATREAALATDHVVAHLSRLHARLSPDFPLSGAVMATWPDDPRERLHAMLRLFEQLYDLVNRRLLRGFLLLSGEDPGSLSAKNLFRRAETLRVVVSADRWIEIGVTRNALVHDYPTNPGAQARHANQAWADLPDLLAGARQAVASLRDGDLI